MASKNTGKEFEELIGEVYEALTQNDKRTKVEIDKKIKSAAGTNRQIDVLVTSEVAGTEIRTVIEAKDWNYSVPVDVVDGLVQKMRSINAHKGVIVSRKGFQSGTVREAKQYDIDLCTAKKISEVATATKQIPTVVHYLPLEQMSVSVSLPASFTNNKIVDLTQVLVNGRSAFDIFREELFTGKLTPKIRRPLTEGELKMQREIKVGTPVTDHSKYEVPMNIWEPESGAKIKYNDTDSGYMITAKKFTIKYFLIYKYYFGYLDDLASTVMLENISTSRSDIFYKLDDLADFRNQFKEFTKLEDIPVSEAANFHCMGDLDVQRLSKEFQIAMASVSR